MSLPEIPDFVLNKRATIKRRQGNGFVKVYEGVPCRLGKANIVAATSDGWITGQIERWRMIVRYADENGDIYNIRPEDIVEVDNEEYTVLAVQNAEMADHHFEIDLERFEDAA